MRFLIYIFILTCFTKCKKQSDLEASFSADNITSAPESEQSVVNATIELNHVADRDVYIKYQKVVVPGSATEGVDYKILPQENYFVIKKGERSKNISFFLVKDSNSEGDEKIVFKITNVYSARLKTSGDLYTFTIKEPTITPVTGYVYLNLNGNFYSASGNNLSTFYDSNDAQGYTYGMGAVFGSSPSFNQYSLVIKSKTILPVGKIIPLTDLTNAPDTGAYVSLFTGSTTINSISGTLKIVTHDVNTKELSLLINGTFTGSNNLSGTIDYYYYDFSH